MEILIAIFSGIAFLALIVYLWNDDAASKHGKQEVGANQSPPPALVNEPDKASLTSTSPAIESEHLAELEQKIEGLNRERAASLTDIEDYKQKAAADRFELREAQASAAASSERVVALEAEISLLHRRLADLDNQQSSRQGEMVSLQQELAKLPACEQEIAVLQKQKAELMEQLNRLEIENAANAQAVLALQDFEAKQSEFTEKLASLREENNRLIGEINGLQSSLRDKIKTQLDGLQELYKNLTPRLN